MEKVYDMIITRHYSSVAKEQGFSSSSTMEDDVVRAMETDVILKFVKASTTSFDMESIPGPFTIMDVGCGNGYTLEILSSLFPKYKYIGIEKNDEFRDILLTRFKDSPNVIILDGDIRDGQFARHVVADILICQRVLINLLDPEDQSRALNNIIAHVRDASRPNTGGRILFLECFKSSLENLNQARQEFSLQPINPAHHNMYITDGFFDVPLLSPIPKSEFSVLETFLSSHYYITRVLHAAISANESSFKRNSEFVKFLSAALPSNIGDYSPLKCYAFMKKFKPSINIAK